MEPDQLAKQLHPLERKVLPKIEGRMEVADLCKATGLKDVEVVRALQWMSNKGILELKSTESETIELGENGRKYIESGLPEKRFLQALDKPLPMGELAKKAGLEGQELNVCIGALKKKVAIELSPDRIISRTEQGTKLLDKGFPEEEFLTSLPLPLSDITPEQKFSFDNLVRRRDIIKVSVRKRKYATLTELGKKIPQLSDDVLERLTPDMLKNGSWKGKEFRRYDVEINVPKRSFGRRHFVNEAVDYARKIWIEMGFKEMRGPLVQTSFWNFDALFTAQDHPVRDMHDTFFLKDPEKGSLPDKKITGAVKKAHESGVAGSRGWQYKWNPETAKRNVLRTHTTVLSAQTIAALKKEDLPAKFFSVGKCFRNETLDYSHLFEFYQVEGIVIDKTANMKNLIGYLTEFFKKMGYPKVRVRPGYFPYTEPSMEVDVYDPKRKQWLELAGSGIFRPEMTEPLFGEEVTVLAWGLGLERTLKEYYKFADIRDIYRNDIGQLKDLKTWVK